MEMNNLTPRTTIGLKKSTKARLDEHRAPGQCYDGFLGQMIDLWERSFNITEISDAGPAGGNQGARVFSSTQA